MNITIALLQSSTDKLGKASQLETFVIQLPATSPWYLGEEPAQMQPDVQQEETQANQHETIGRIAGGRPAPHLSCAAITGFDTETMAVGSLGLMGRKVQVDQDEDQPAGCPGRIFPSVQRSMLIGAFWSPPGVVMMQAT